MAKSESTQAAASWWQLPLGDALLASPRLLSCQADVEAYARTALDAAAIVLCVRTETVGLHCQQTLYFSPELAELARRYDATACARPHPDSVHILLGSRQNLG